MTPPLPARDDYSPPPARHVTYFAAQRSPTACLLDLWFARRPDSPSAGGELLNMLQSLGQQDAVRVLETELAGRDRG